MPTAAKCPGERQPGPPGPDDANRCHGELVSFRPLTRCRSCLSLLRAYQPSAGRVTPGRSPASRARQSAGTREASRSSSGASTKPRSDILGCGTTRSGSEMLRSPNEKDVDVEGARAVSNGADPACQRLDRVREVQELPRAQVRLEADDTVQVPALALRAAERSRLVDGRHAQVSDRSRAALRRRSSRWPMRSPMFEPRPKKRLRSHSVGHCVAALASQAHPGRGEVGGHRRPELADRTP